MKDIKKLSIVIVLVAAALLLAGTLLAQETKAAPEILKGWVKSVDLTNNTVVIKDAYKKETTVFVEDSATLGRLKGGSIAEGDMVRVKYVTKDGKKVATVISPERLE